MTSGPRPADRPDERTDERDAGRVPAGWTGSYLTAVGHEVGTGGLTPAALARAAVQVLPVEGAALSILLNVLRLPLGASSADARRAEELQTSLGEGPCLDAAAAQRSVVVDLDDLGTRWTSYGEELLTTTPFRSVAAIPLVGPGRGVFAALDVYSTEPQISERLDPHDLDEIPTAVAALLATCIEQIDDVDTPDSGPLWYQEAAGRRHDVWVAIGMVMAGRARRTRDALSLLRAHAYSNHQSLDDLAADLIEGRVALADVSD